jgi:glutathione S-transferase
MAYTKSGESPSGLVEAATALEKLIIGKYALGDHFTAADASIAPFILRSEVALEVKGGEDGLSQLQQRTPRFWQYYQDLKAHPSVARTFDRVRSITNISWMGANMLGNDRT